MSKTRTLSPKQVADAIGVSESSLKRWCDKGQIRFSKTVGGHRRITRVDVIDFVRNKRQVLANPDILGLPSIDPNLDLPLEEIATQFEESLLAADENKCRELVMRCYLAGRKLSGIVDMVIGQSFKNIGLSWACDNLEIYKERVACEITVRLINELRSIQPEPDENAMLAIGGTCSGDHYTMPTQVVDLQFAHMGWRTQNLGCNLPFPSLKQAALDYRPNFFWLSISHIDDKAEFVQSLQQFTNGLPPGIALVIGGSSLQPDIQASIPNAIFCSKIQQLEAYLSTIKQSAQQANTAPPQTDTDNGTTGNHS